MADKLPFEEPIRRVMDANLRYYEALGQVTQEYWKAVFGVFRDLPIRLGAQPQAASAARATPANPTAPASAASLVLEAESGAEAQGVFMVENRLARTVSTAVVISAFADPSGRTIQPALRVTPGVVTLQPGGRTLVQIIAPIGDELEPDSAYRGEVSVPGLSEHGIPVLLRRLPSASVKAGGGSTAAASAESAATKPAAKKGSRRRSSSKKSSKKTARKRGGGEGRTSGS